MSRYLAVALVALLAPACTVAPVDTLPHDLDDTVLPAAVRGRTRDVASRGWAPRPSQFRALEQALEAARAEHEAATGAAPPLGFALYDDEGLVFRRVYGGFSRSERVAVASASKLVSALVLLTLIGDGHLSLDATTGDVLGWGGPKGAITLRQLLSFTSGLTPDAPCISNPTTTLAACVAQIRARPAVAPPGTRFDYGPAHLHVAARLAEVATGQSWATLFAERIRQPLGLPGEVAYFTAPRQGVGTTNPLIAGGLRTSMDDYAAILRQVARRGAGEVVVPMDLFAEQAREPYPDVAIGRSPLAALGYPWRYGLGAWLECATPASGCDVLSSPGAFGFTPWIDHRNGYYAVLAMELDAAEDGVAAFAVRLQQTLRALIPAALAAR